MMSSWVESQGHRLQLNKTLGFWFLDYGRAAVWLHPWPSSPPYITRHWWGARKMPQDYHIIFFFLGGGHAHMACMILILVSWPGIKPLPPAVELWNLNHWTAREVPYCLLETSRCHRFFFVLKIMFINTVLCKRILNPRSCLTFMEIKIDIKLVL